MAVQIKYNYFKNKDTFRREFVRQVESSYAVDFKDSTTYNDATGTKYIQKYASVFGLDEKTGLISSVFEETFTPYLGKAGEYAGVDTNVEVYVGLTYVKELAEKYSFKAFTSNLLFLLPRTISASVSFSAISGKDCGIHPVSTTVLSGYCFL